MLNPLKLYEGVWVEWNVEQTNIPCGKGRVRGFATASLPGAGRGVIVEVHNQNQDPAFEDYGFSCFVVPEACLELSND